MAIKWHHAVISLISLLLAIAAAIKSYDLLANPSAWVEDYPKHGLMACLIAVEFLLASLLFLRMFLPVVTIFTAVTFGLFACYSGWLVFSGEHSCGCFGRTFRLDPLISFALDVVIALFMVHPRVRTMVNRPSVADLSWRNVFSFGCAVGLASILFVAGHFWLASAEAHQKHSSSADTTAGSNRSMIARPDRWLSTDLPIIEQIANNTLLRHGKWTLLFHRRDCSDCRSVLERLRAKGAIAIGSDSSENHTALIAVDEEADAVFSRFPELRNRVAFFRIAPSVDLSVTTPLIVDLVDLRVSRVDVAPLGRTTLH